MLIRSWPLASLCISLCSFSPFLPSQEKWWEKRTSYCSNHVWFWCQFATMDLPAGQDAKFGFWVPFAAALRITRSQAMFCNSLTGGQDDCWSSYNRSKYKLATRSSVSFKEISFAISDLNGDPHFPWLPQIIHICSFEVLMLTPLPSPSNEPPLPLDHVPSHSFQSLPPCLSPAW